MASSFFSFQNFQCVSKQCSDIGCRQILVLLLCHSLYNLYSVKESSSLITFFTN
jgi:hypothetical protein